jgi:hypothetical protein
MEVKRTMTSKPLKEFVCLVSIMAENEDDFIEQLEALDSYELEWFKQVRT